MAWIRPDTGGAPLSGLFAGAGFCRFGRSCANGVPHIVQPHEDGLFLLAQEISCEFLPVYADLVYYHWWTKNGVTMLSIG